MKEFNYTEHYKIDAEEFNYFEDRPGATAHDESRVHQYIVSKVPANVKTILDVGCGSSWVAGSFLAKGKKVISLDISTINPFKALQKFPSEKHFGVTADSYILPFNDDTLDCIIASEIIEHLLYPDKFIKELLRVLKPGCRLIITTPYKELIRYSLCIHCNQKTPMHAHLHSFDENKLLSLYQGNNLDSVYWKTFGNKILIFLRTYVVLRYFPFGLWKFVDKLSNMIYNLPAHIILVYTKK
ncbi:MAG: class I SAM-dependent methyltransferase [Ignavibacteriaceae bacterium]|nr:class I SAM-dependent methyltransferase [Ignavibacteriaceae bacterium]